MTFKAGFFLMRTQKTEKNPVSTLRYNDVKLFLESTRKFSRKWQIEKAFFMHKYKVTQLQLPPSKR